MKRRHYWFLIASVVVSILLLVRTLHDGSREVIKPEGNPQMNPSAAATPQIRPTNPVPADMPLVTPTARGGVRPLSSQERAYLAEFRRPIDFYGVVLEEVSQTPVAGAQVYLSPLDDPGGEHDSEYRRVIDKEGGFSITGAHGHDLYVKVTKSGYYETKLSHGSFVHEYPSESVGSRLLAKDSGAPRPPSTCVSRAARPPSWCVSNTSADACPAMARPQKSAWLRAERFLPEDISW